MPKTLKEEVINILSPIFGDPIKKSINELYDETDDELFNLSERMLTGYFGEERAQKIMNDLLRKFPKMAHAEMHA